MDNTVFKNGTEDDRVYMRSTNAVNDINNDTSMFTAVFLETLTCSSPSQYICAQYYVGHGSCMPRIRLDALEDIVNGSF